MRSLRHQPKGLIVEVRQVFQDFARGQAESVQSFFGQFNAGAAFNQSCRVTAGATREADCAEKTRCTSWHAIPIV
jgi:hypothetical protein